MSAMLSAWLNEAHVPQPACAGYLWKKKQRVTTISTKYTNSLVPQWTKRYFTLEGMLLRWRWSSMSTEASGTIDLREICCLRSCVDQHETDFLLQTNNRAFFLRAPSAVEARKWIVAINMYSDRAMGGDGSRLLPSMMPGDAEDKASPRKTETTNSVGLDLMGGSIEDRLDATLAALTVLEVEVSAEQDRDAEKHRTRSKHLPPSEPRPSKAMQMTATVTSRPTMTDD